MNDNSENNLHKSVVSQRIENFISSYMLCSLIVLIIAFFCFALYSVAHFFIGFYEVCGIVGVLTLISLFSGLALIAGILSLSLPVHRENDQSKR